MNIGSMSNRGRIAIVVAALGVLVVARTLSNAWPRETPILYEVGPGITALDVDFLQEGEAISSVRFRRPAESSKALSHEPRLAPGSYQLHLTVRVQDGGAAEDVRTLLVPAAGLTRIDLRGLGSRSTSGAGAKALRFESNLR